MGHLIHAVRQAVKKIDVQVLDDYPEIPTGKTCIPSEYRSSLGVVLFPCPYYRLIDKSDPGKGCRCDRFGYSHATQDFSTKPCQIRMH